MPSAVLDSTVLISAFLAQRGVSNELLRHARAGAFLLFLSEEILNEALGVLLDNKRRHRQRYHYPHEEAINFIDGLRALAHLVTDIPEVTVVIRDPNDDIVVATLNAPRSRTLSPEIKTSCRCNTMRALP